MLIKNVIRPSYLLDKGLFQYNFHFLIHSVIKPLISKRTNNFYTARMYTGQCDLRTGRQDYTSRRPRRGPGQPGFR